MKWKWIIAIAVLGSFAILVGWLWNAGNGAFTLSVRGAKPGAVGMTLVGVSNGGPSEVWFAVGREEKTAAGWMNPKSNGRIGGSSQATMWESPEPLAPGAERVVEVPTPTSGLPWRPVAWYGRHYSSDGVGRIREKLSELMPGAVERRIAHGAEVAP